MTGKLTNGFSHLKAFFSDSALRSAEEAIAQLYWMQVKKIGDYQIDTTLYWEPGAFVSHVNELLDKDDKEALYQVQKQFPQSRAIHGLFDGPCVHRLAEALDCTPNQVLIEGPGLFVSRPNDTRLKYKWHSEAHYYPKRRRFLNIWLPVFTDRTLADGAMTILPGSHTEHWDFAEYTGFNKDSENKKNHFVQYEIPEKWLAGYERYNCDSKRGDVILFDRNLVHRSNVNTTDKYSFSIVARAWTPIDDLTISGSMAATPYGGDIGRANLNVER